VNPLAPLGLLLQALTAVVFVALAAVLVHALVRGNRRRAITAVGVGAGWSAVYLLAVVAVSLFSSQRVLGLGEAKRFCGFYLDCHAMISVVEVDTFTSLGSPDASVAAEGVFWVVTLRQNSDAVGAEIGLDRPDAVLIDESGRRHHRSDVGERALAAAGGPQPQLGRAIEPAESYSTRFVFDVPAEVAVPRMLVAERGWITRLSELFLLGDEDSVLHERSVFRLST
jgi:hypothetical protein